MTEKANKPNIPSLPNVKGVLTLVIVATVAWGTYQVYSHLFLENKVLKQMVARLEADSRVAQVFVTDVQFNSLTNEHMTTIKFLEFDTAGMPLEPKYFTFSGNIIQFQSLVVRFDDIHVRGADPLRGKSVYLFWKVFVLDGAKTQEYPITEINAIPDGYKTGAPRNAFEDAVWKEFWALALDPKKNRIKGVKNAQIEAPGTKFVTGLLYTLRIEHDGGLRIDPSPIPDVLKGEKIQQ